jgi:2-phosphosulfolactate phosphatase
MSASCQVFLLPALATEEDFFRSTTVVIDVLRATTTIAYALAAGAKAVVPCFSVEEAQKLAAATGAGALLGGERGGERIAGFDLGNSPAEYTAEKLSGRSLVFTTTNGTRALQHARCADRLLLAAFVNFSAVCRELLGRERIAILCAGTDGQITREDTLLAGAIVDELLQGPTDKVWELNDQAEIAADAWRALLRNMSTGVPLASHLRSSLGARNLIELGMERDIDIAAQIDQFDFVPELDVATWQITRA